MERMEMESCIPPGFRFHPTEEELVGYYLKRKISSMKFDLDVITDIDLYKMEPWDIEDTCRLGYEEQKEWYFFSHKDRKYPTGTRTNRATTAGFWKATGRDKAVLSKEKIIGMRKTLVFYKGRAPNGRKTDWIMHEFRLQTSELGPPQEEGWVVCRAFKKPNPSHKQGYQAWNNTCYIGNNMNTYKPPSYPGTPDLRPNYDATPNQSMNSHPDPFPGKSGRGPFESQMVERPNIDSPSISTSFATNDNSFEQNVVASEEIEDENGIFGNEFCDWTSFDRLIASHVAWPSPSSSYCYPNAPLAAKGDAMDAHNYISCVLQPDGL